MKNNDRFRFNGHNNRDQGYIEWEREILTPLAGTERLYALPVNNWWSQIKTAGSAIYANRHFLELYKRTHIDRLATQGIKDNNPDGESLVCNVIGDVCIHPSASIHPSATVSLNNNWFRPETHSNHLFPNSSDRMYRLGLA